MGTGGHRDATMILLAFRHGLRASELCSLRWEQVDLGHGRLHVSRIKSGMPSVHPLTGTELRALRRLQREQEPGRYVFMSERGAPMSAVGFRRMVTRLGEAAKMPFQIHPHMLRHACGYTLANRGVDTRALQLSRAQEYPAYGQVHRAKSRQVPGFLEGLIIRGGAQVTRISPRRCSTRALSVDRGTLLIPILRLSELRLPNRCSVMAWGRSLSNPFSRGIGSKSLALRGILGCRWSQITCLLPKLAPC